MQDKVSKTLTSISKDPMNPSLRSHKVGNYWSSRVTGDIRIIWEYGNDDKVNVIEILDVGGHSGSNKVYGK